MKKRFDYALAAAGLLLVGAGLYMLRTVAEPQGVLLTLPYVCIGLGCGIFGHGMAGAIGKRLVASDPATARRMEIEAKDERNLAISSRAKAKAYDSMVFVFGVLQLVFVLLEVRLAAILLLVAAYLSVVGCGIYYRMKYEKEM